MRRVPLCLSLFLSVVAGVVGCADPNPTFVFDAATTTTAHEGGTDAPAEGHADAGTHEGGGASDAAAEAR
jgi:hypothetical protein